MDFKFQRISSFPFTGIAGLVCLLGYVGLAWYSNGLLEEPKLGVFFGFLAWVSIPVLFLFLWGKRLSLLEILLWSVAFQLCGFFAEPLFEDDFFRYLWDGYVFAENGTPYGYRPVDFFGVDTLPPSVANLLDGINYPDLPTIYGPTNQYLFVLGYFVAPAELFPIKTALIAANVGIIWLLSRLANIKFVLLYAWCPLVIYESIYAAHVELIGIALLIVACLCSSKGRTILAGSTLALALASKVFVLAFVPFILLRIGLRGTITFGVCLFLLYLPFLVQEGSELTSLVAFANNWVFNAGLYTLLAELTDPTRARTVLGVVYVTILAIMFNAYRRRGIGEIPRGDIIFGVFLVLSPVVNTWYVLWVLPFAVIYPSRAAWVASFAVFLAYVTAINIGDYDADPFSQPHWILLLEYGIILIALSLDVYLRITRGMVVEAKPVQTGTNLNLLNGNQVK